MRLASLLINVQKCSSDYDYDCEIEERPVLLEQSMFERDPMVEYHWSWEDPYILIGFCQGISRSTRQQFSIIGTLPTPTLLSLLFYTLVQ